MSSWKKKTNYLSHNRTSRHCCYSVYHILLAIFSSFFTSYHIEEPARQWLGIKCWSKKKNMTVRLTCLLSIRYEVPQTLLYSVEFNYVQWLVMRQRLLLMLPIFCSRLLGIQPICGGIHTILKSFAITHRISTAANDFRWQNNYIRLCKA